jgi:heat shock 70kDa protein 1/2/6/8
MDVRSSLVPHQSDTLSQAPAAETKPISLGNQTPTEADTAAAVALKDAGNAAFTAKNFGAAIEKFSAAIEKDGTNHVFFSNRSAALLSVGRKLDALADARRTVELAPAWGKGYGRLGAALHSLERYADAVAAFTQGIPLDASNSQLSSGLLAAQQALKKEKDAEGEEDEAEDDDGISAAMAKASVGGAGSGSSSSGAVPPPPAAEPEVIIGIDLGTTYSCVGVWQNERVEIIANSEGSRTTASVVGFTEHDRLIGASAVAQAAGNAANTVSAAARGSGEVVCAACTDRPSPPPPPLRTHARTPLSPLSSSLPGV